MAPDREQPIRLSRNPDRRKQSTPVSAERRVAPGDRRCRGLEWLSLFHGAEEPALLEAIGGSEILVLHPAETLLKPGQANTTVFLVLAGELGAYLGDSLASEGVIPIAPGECLGELSAIDGKPVSARVEALTETRLLVLSQDTFWNRLMAVPGVARNLMAVLAERMRRNTQSMLEGQRRKIELEYLRQELDVAHQLQVGMLPAQGALFPERQDLEIAGMMEAASFIGGDLFDAFFVDEQRLFFCIGDVSGHGIPAAMFMARAVTLMRIAAIASECPASVLQQVNEQLCAGNDANMFVTLFCGFLEVASGRTVYSNGGHLAPLYWRDGAAHPLPIPKGALIGVIPGARYARHEIVLEQGEFILCYTDGVTEAQTPAGEEYSESRLLGLLAHLADHPLDRVLTGVRASVADYSGDSRLADDCTMLAIRRPLR